MKDDPTCSRCGVELCDDNWYPSCQRTCHHICKKCDNLRKTLWQDANPDKVKAIHARGRRKRGVLPYSENKKCSQYLGVHIAENVLRHVFNDVKVMPHNNPGYDFICGGGHKIDVKSSCRHHSRYADNWVFYIKKNKMAKYFLCIAFDNRDDITPEHVWLIPSDEVNDKTGASIAITTLDKWKEYELPIDKVITCCNSMKETQ